MGPSEQTNPIFVNQAKVSPKIPIKSKLKLGFFLIFIMLGVAYVGYYIGSNKNKIFPKPISKPISIQSSSPSSSIFDIKEGEKTKTIPSTLPTNKNPKSNELYYKSKELYPDLVNFNILVKFPENVLVNSNPSYDKQGTRFSDSDVTITGVKYYINNLAGWVGGFPPCNEADELCKSEYFKEIFIDATDNAKSKLKLSAWGNKNGIYKIQISGLANSLGLETNRLLNDFSIFKDFNASECIANCSSNYFNEEDIRTWKKIITEMRIEIIR